jgi:hypothetical protein
MTPAFDQIMTVSGGPALGTSLPSCVFCLQRRTISGGELGPDALVRASEGAAIATARAAARAEEVRFMVVFGQGEEG